MHYVIRRRLHFDIGPTWPHVPPLNRSAYGCSHYHRRICITVALVNFWALKCI